MDTPRSPSGNDPAPSPASIDRLILTGFMGSGKTTVGRLLAHRLGWRFVDLDEEIERRAGRTVAEIFAADGEPAFRALETEALNTLLSEPRLVLALGGGAVETAANRARLAADPRTCVILLTAPFATLYERCQDQRADPSAAVRPLLGDPASAEQRLARRQHLYRAAAGICVDTRNQTPEQTVESLLLALRGTL